MARGESSSLEANKAALLTWLVPGAAHLWLGRPGLGLVAFALVEGLYWAGLRLSGGMGFELLDHELRSLLAPALAPESGNLGGFIYQMRVFGYGPGYLRPWPDQMALGGMLTALSGVLNACWMAHAHVLARSERPELAGGRHRPALALGLAFLVPGLGHLYQGRRRRGISVFIALVGLFLAGTWLAEGSNLSRERHFYYWSGQFLIGLPAAVAEWIGGGMRITHAIPLVDAGLVFACVAGLLNVIAMIDVFDFEEARLFGWPSRTLAKAGAGAARAKEA
jgi:hypothetical protein